MILFFNANLLILIPLLTLFRFNTGVTSLSSYYANLASLLFLNLIFIFFWSGGLSAPYGSMDCCVALFLKFSSNALKFY